MKDIKPPKKVWVIWQPRGDDEPAEVMEGGITWEKKEGEFFKEDLAPGEMVAEYSLVEFVRKPAEKK